MIIFGINPSAREITESEAVSTIRSCEFSCNLIQVQYLKHEGWGPKQG